MVCLWSTAVSAIDRLVLELGSLTGTGWQAEGLQWEVGLGSSASTGLKISRLILPEPYGEVKAVVIDCPGLVVEKKRLACPAGTASGQAPWLGEQVFGISFDYRPDSMQLALEVNQLPLFGGTLNLGLSAENFIDLAIRLDGNGLNMSSSDGRFASEALTFLADARLKQRDDGWQGPVKLNISAGQAYAEPVFIDFTEHPVTLSADMKRNELGVIGFSNALVKQRGVLGAEMHGQWLPDKGIDLNGKLEQAKLRPVYGLYVQPYLLGTALAELEMEGQLNAEFELAGNMPRALHANIEQLVMEDKKGRFAWDSLGGEIHWREQGDTPASRLTWKGGAAYQILFGASEVSFQLGGRNMRFLAPLRVPMLEGALVVNQLGVQSLGSDDMALQFDGKLEPMSLESLTTALGWPRFGGTLAGRLPDLDYRQGQLTLGGALQAEVFEGEVSVENLRMQNPFGRLPQLFADISLRGLNLETLTQAFSFGRIEGRLEGEVRGLQMLNWQPVAFDARLQTPKDDKSRHRISQRAIENISSIGGGGATAVLSRGFMQFFDDFAYDRIGLSCRLQGNVCKMGGIGPSKDGNGYVLVKGRLLPRIDVVGYAQQVDWPTLVEQLKSVTEGEGPELR